MRFFDHKSIIDNIAIQEWVEAMIMAISTSNSDKYNMLTFRVLLLFILYHS